MNLTRERTIALAKAAIAGALAMGATAFLLAVFVTGMMEPEARRPPNPVLWIGAPLCGAAAFALVSLIGNPGRKWKLVGAGFLALLYGLPLVGLLFLGPFGVNEMTALFLMTSIITAPVFFVTGLLALALLRYRPYAAVVEAARP